MKKKQLLFLLALLMTAATGAWAQNAVSTNIVTQGNFYNYFDDSGFLRDDVPFDELIFKGEFSGLAAGYVIIDKPITITGYHDEDTGDIDAAVLNDMGIVILSEDVAIDSLTLTATTSLGDLIYVGASNVDLTNLNITYTVDDGSANVINVAGDEDDRITNVNILNNTINFESHVTSDEDLVTAINLDNVEDVIVDGNTIAASLPALTVFTYDYTYFMMGLCNVNPIRLYEAHTTELTNNKVDVVVNSFDGDFSTVQALYIVGSEDILVEGNDFKMVDALTPAGTPIYPYAVECGFSEGIEFIENNFDISTTGGKSGSGSVYVLQVATTDATFIGNNITCECNGPIVGIFSPYGFGPAKDLEIKNNFIDITGSATGSNEFALISGIEIQTGYATIYDNTIHVQNKGGYDDSYPVSGISAIQYSASTLSFDIQDNDIYVPDGKYAVEMLYAPSEATVTGNALIAHELTGNSAVYFKSGNNNTVENNLHGSVNMPKTGKSTYNIPANVPSFKVYDDGGISGRYSPGCTSTLTLTAPEGYLLQLSGNIKTEKDVDYLTVYDGSDNQAYALIDQMSSSGNDTKTDIPTVTSTGNVMTLYFYSNNSGSDKTEFDGLDLTVTLISTSAVVTQSNFYDFFDEYGNLLDNVTYDELIFQGEFSDLVDIIMIPDDMTLTGDNAVLNNIALSITGDDVTVTGLTLNENGADFTDNGGAAIYVSGFDVTLDSISVTYDAPSEVEAKAIFADGAGNFKLIKSEIIFTGANPGENHYRGLEVRDCDGAVIDNDTISATFPAVPVDWGVYGSIAQDLVLAVGIQGGNNVEFTNNRINVNTNGEIGTYPTIDAIMVYSADDILIQGNTIRHFDTTTEESPRYYYSLDIYSTTGTVEANNIIVNTTTTADDDRAGSAFPIQLTGPFKVTVKDNNVTGISKGAISGIYASTWGGEANLTAENNNIDVTGYATTGNYALVDGIEAQIDTLKAYNNTITVENVADYDDANQVIGVGIGSGWGDTSADIKGNNMTVDGKYAVYYAKAEDTNVTGNTLYAHELTGDDAVVIEDGDNNTVENNLPVNLTAQDAGEGEYWSTYYYGLADVAVSGDGDASVTIYKAKVSDDQTKLVLTKVEGNVVKKGEAVLLKSESANITISSANPEAEMGDFTGNELQGVDVRTACDDILADGTFYVMSKIGDDFGFFEYIGDYMPAHKAFIALASSASAPLRGLSFVEEETTNIESVDSGQWTVDSWYTLSGVKLEGKPTEKGVYIHNGRKYIIQ